MTVTPRLPKNVRYLPVPVWTPSLPSRGRNIQTGTAILNLRGFFSMNKYFLLTITAAALFVSSCGSATQPNTNTAANTAIKVDNANMPAGLSTSPIPPSTNTTPGIPAANAVNTIPKGTTPTPGIPDPKTLGKPLKPGLTPTPGIPDQETLRRQLQKSASNVNTPPAAGGEDSMMMKSRKKPAAVNKP